MNEGIFVPCAPFLYLVPDSGTSAGAAGLGTVRTGPHGSSRDRSGPHMEVSRRVSPAPFHYLITEQAKSLVALQELQHEVGALLEFRELVMDTFPHLRHKLCGSPGVGGLLDPASPGRSPGARGESPTPGQRRDWEPGVRVRRKLSPKGAKDKGVQPKSGDTLSAGSAVQDSGFSTETSCKEQSKDVVVTATASTAMPSTGAHDEAEDELWNLLDVIQRKGTRLRDEVEVLQEKLQDMKDVDGGEGLASMDADVEGVEGDLDVEGPPRAFKPGGSMRGGGSFAEKVFAGEQLREVKFERDYLLDKMSEMEAETLAARVRAETLARDVTALAGAKRELEEQLRTAVLQKGELNSRIHDLHIRFVSSATTKKLAAPSAVRATTSNPAAGGVAPSAFASVNSSAFAQVPRSTKPSDPSVIQPTSLTRSIKEPTSLTRSIKEPTSLTRSIKQPTSLTRSIKQPTLLTRSIKEPTSLTRSIKEPTSLTRSIKQPTSLSKSPETTTKQALIRSNTFDVARSATKSPPRPKPSIKQPAARSETFKLSARRTSPTKSTAESIEESPRRLVSPDATRCSENERRLLEDDTETATLNHSKSCESITKTFSQATTLDAATKDDAVGSESTTKTPTPEIPTKKSALRSRTITLWTRQSVKESPASPASVMQSPTRLLVRLGQLDGVVSRPGKLPRGMKPELDKMAAVLRETNVVELQRHLLVTCVENQRLAARDSQLRARIARLSDDNDELSFRLAEREIELEGARAQIRVLDRNADSASPRRRPSKIPKSSAPKPPSASANQPISHANQSVGSQFANQAIGNQTSNTSVNNQTVPSNRSATNEPINKTVQRASPERDPHPSLTERTVPRAVPEAPRTAHAAINGTASRTSLNNSLTSSIPSLTRTARNGSAERVARPVPTRTGPVSNRTGSIATRTVSNPSLTNRSQIQPPSNRSVIGQSNRSLSSNSLNKKKSLESVRRGGGGGKRDVSIGYRKEGRRKEEGPTVVAEKREDSVPWANDSSSEYFDSINESGSLLLASEPPHWLAGQREAMAECDSLELELAESNQWQQSH